MTGHRRGLPAEGDLPTAAALDAHESPEASAAPAASRRRTPWWPWILMVVVLVGALVVGATDAGGPPTGAERASTLARSLKCPVCAGQSVAESDVVVSREIRRDVVRRIDAGETDEQIRSAYVASYGQDILLSPPTSGVSALVWILPVLLLVAGVVAVVLAFRRWHRDADRHPSDEDRALVAEALADPRPRRDDR